MLHNIALRYHPLSADEVAQLAAQIVDADDAEIIEHDVGGNFRRRNAIIATFPVN